MKIIIKLIVIYGVIFSTLLYGEGLEHDVIKRAELAKLVLLAKNNDVDYLPPVAIGGQFSDVQLNSFNARWIEQLKADGITEGCALDKFCPNAVVTKGQLAKILLKAKYGVAYVPPLAKGIYDDVSINLLNADWIEALKELGISTGCDNNKFCPNEVISVADFYEMLSKALGDIVTIHEDAENMDAVGWDLYATTVGSTITNEFDAEKGNRVIVLQGNDGLDNGFYWSQVAS